MSGRVIIDATAIVGSLSSTDQWRGLAVPHFAQLPKPFLTCEPVITETCFIMRKAQNGEAQTLGLIKKKLVEIDFTLANEIEAITTLMERYRSVPMSLADACLVRMSEMFDAPIFTFDTDFRIYRRNKRSAIPLIGIDN